MIQASRREVLAVLLPLPRSDRRLPELQRVVVGLGLVAWYWAHEPFASTSIFLHAFLFTGVSPK